MSKAANNSSTSDNVTNCKVVILGDQNVGKSSILMRYFGHEITTDYRPTIGIDFCSKIIEKDKKMIRLYIWDTAGQERFRSLISTYLRDCNIAVVVYDITSQQSFDHLKAWFDYIHRECGDRVQTVLVGNKSDLSNQRIISKESGEEYANSLKQCKFVEVSAVKNFNVKELFDIVSEMACRSKCEASKREGTVRLDETSESSTSTACSSLC